MRNAFFLYRNLLDLFIDHVNKNGVSYFHGLLIDIRNSYTNKNITYLDAFSY